MTKSDKYRVGVFDSSFSQSTTFLNYACYYIYQHIGLQIYQIPAKNVKVTNFQRLPIWTVCCLSQADSIFQCYLAIIRPIWKPSSNKPQHLAEITTFFKLSRQNLLNTWRLLTQSQGHSESMESYPPQLVESSHSVVFINELNSSCFSSVTLKNGRDKQTLGLPCLFVCWARCCLFTCLYGVHMSYMTQCLEEGSVGLNSAEPH